VVFAVIIVAPTATAFGRGLEVISLARTGLADGSRDVIGTPA
jgi:hypothetical protein